MGINSKLVGFIWDIDGVVVDSPHEEAWRITAMQAPWNVEELSSEFYFKHVASRPRFEGGNNILELKGVYKRLCKRPEDKNVLLEKFCRQKNALILQLISEGKFKLFEDAVELVLTARKAGILQASASASKNVRAMLTQVSRARIIREIGSDFAVMKENETLYSLFDVDACGLDLGGKANIIEYAASKLLKLSANAIKKIVVFEDAPSGVAAAKALGYYAVGVLRIGEKSALENAGADIVVDDLRKIRLEDVLEL